jgi:hypothetical protein
MGEKEKSEIKKFVSEIVEQEIGNQFTATRAMIIDKFELIDQKLGLIQQMNEKDHQVLKSYDSKQNGHIKEQGDLMKGISDRLFSHIEHHPTPAPEDRVTCPAYKTDSFLRKSWWKIVVGLGFMFIFYEWLYHDTALFERFRQLMEHLKIFKV